MMEVEAMTPHGRAMLAYAAGRVHAQLTILRDDGFEASLPVSHFFRSTDEFSAIEVEALERCVGKTLDVGAGTGLHSLALLSRGLDVTAIDISPEAVEIMVDRGVHDLHCADVFSFEGGPYDTVLMLGHGLGIAETLTGLDRLLKRARGLIRRDGRFLVDSLDVRRTTETRHLAYHEANRRAGRYVGETRVRFRYDEYTGPLCGWLHVDPETLCDRAKRVGWDCEIVRREEWGDFLACLTKMGDG